MAAAGAASLPLLLLLLLWRAGGRAVGRVGRQLSQAMWAMAGLRICWLAGLLRPPLPLPDTEVGGWTDMGGASSSEAPPRLLLQQQKYTR